MLRVGKCEGNPQLLLSSVKHLYPLEVSSSDTIASDKEETQDKETIDEDENMEKTKPDQGAVTE